MPISDGERWVGVLLLVGVSVVCVFNHVFINRSGACACIYYQGEWSVFVADAVAFALLCCVCVCVHACMC